MHSERDETYLELRRPLLSHAGIMAAASAMAAIGHGPRAVGGGTGHGGLPATPAQRAAKKRRRKQAQASRRRNRKK